MEKSLNTRTKILTAADRLFNEVGVHETGIDRIIAESGVAKKSFYNHFPSKIDLIRAYLEHRDKIWFERLNRYTADEKAPPLERFLALFDALKEWYLDPDFYGCAFIRGLSDFAEKGNEKSLTNCVDSHFVSTAELVAKLLKPVRPRDYKKFIPMILSLITGGTIVAHATRDPSVADTNKEMARKLLKLKTKS